MSVENYTQRDGEGEPAPIVIAPRERRRRRQPGRQARGRGPRAPRPRVRKLRLLFVLTGFAVLALISTMFGVLTSIASDLPQLDNTVQFSKHVESYMYDDNGNPIGPLAPASTPAIDHWDQISPNMRNAIVSVEDHGFWSESGISVRGLLRAGLSDLTGGKLEGGSTIPEEFVKNVRDEEGHRTVAEKLVEAGMAFQLSHHWTHAHILTEYLNTIYFGNGALGIEAAARTYFGWNHGYDAANPADGGKNACGNADPQHPHRKECAAELTVAQAALLAAMVANPTAFDPILHPRAAEQRRNQVVLRDMYEQHYIDYSQYETAINTRLPTAAQIKQPSQEPSAAPYFTSWVEPQVVKALENQGLSPKQAQYQADYGGLKIKLSIDLDLQNEAQTAVDDELPSGEGLPSASLIAISNKTGEVRAMVSGNNDYQTSPFNLATMGYRQPGSSFKIFTLAAALSKGVVTPYTPFDSMPITIHFVKTDAANPYKGNAYATPSGTGRFPVRDFGNVYSGEIPLTEATAISDNSVFAQLGTEQQVGTAAIANYAKLMGIRTPVSRNPSMILGGLKYGVSALDMAHAYATAADGGVKLYNPELGDNDGPIGIDKISGIDCGNIAKCKRTIANTRADGLVAERVMTPAVAAAIDQLFHGPVDDPGGTGTAAAIPGVDVVGKTGTTSNYVDAWFVGWTPQMTVAVWVGYPNSGRPMTTQFDGGPVEGGTYPAIIWRNYVTGALQILQDERQQKQSEADTVTDELTTNTASPATGLATTPASTATTTASAATTTTPAQSTATSDSDATSSATAGAPSDSGSTNAPANQTETLPQQTSAPPAAAGSSTTGSNGGAGL